MLINEFWTKIFVYGYIVVSIIVLFIIVILSQKKEEFNYDERQMLARNKAYKYAFTFLFCYNIVCCGLDYLKIIKWAMPSVLLFIGVFLSATIFNVICILENAYKRYNEKIDSKSSSIFFLGLGFLYIAHFFYNLKHTTLITDGLLNENIFPLFLAIMFLSIPIAQFVKKQIDRKSVDEE